MALPGRRTNPDLVAARFLLKPGRKYEQAMKAFEPYDSIKEENSESRAAGRALIAEGIAAGPKRRTFIYVNNRLEGNLSPGHPKTTCCRPARGPAHDWHPG